MSTDRGVELVDRLIDCWSAWEQSEAYYLNDLVPAIARGDTTLGLTDTEKALITDLREILSDDEWQALPELVRSRRSERVADRSRREAKRRDKEARKRERAEEEKRRRVLKRKDLAELNRRAAQVRDRMLQAFEADYLNADDAFEQDPDRMCLSDADYKELKVEFVRDWAKRELDHELDEEQAAAVALVGRNVRVVARAGSGKTRTLVTRAVFLVQHCKVPPRALLLLAFNRRAATEMRKRLATSLTGELPHVMTFHALAYALVHPEEELVFDDQGNNQLGLSREVQEVIDEHIHSPEHGPKIRSLMLAHYRDEWEAIVKGGFDLTMQEFLEHRRALPREALAGDFVKSHGEKVIANTLFENGVDYRYERNFRWNGINYRPDFTIVTGQRSGVVIEYFGLQGDPDYDEQAQQKRDFWATYQGWTLLEYQPSDVAQGTDRFTEKLLGDLERAGVDHRPRSEEEIWSLIRRRAIDRFTSAMRTFVGRCRKRGLTEDELASLVERHRALDSMEDMFLDVGISVHREYLLRLATVAKEDFDGLMWRAVALVQSGSSRFARDGGREQGDLGRVRHIMIDEFQDFSQMFHELIAAVRSVNDDVQFFCVGDDWQAINAFAGSDLSFFSGFGDYFSNSETTEIRTNYRSTPQIVEVGNGVMAGRGAPARASRTNEGNEKNVWLCDLAKFEPTMIEADRCPGDDITPAVLRLVKWYLDRGQDVALLARRNGLPWYVGHDAGSSRIADELDRFLSRIRDHLDEHDRPRVSISTTHKFKGLEEGAVVILDALSGSYPLLHPSWVFLRVFGDNLDKLEDDERRLFYVAVTRAEQSLAIVSDGLRTSPFIDDARSHARLTPVDWPSLPPVAGADGARVEIAVFNSYYVKEQLKDRKYRWDQRRRCWAKVVDSEIFHIDKLLSQPWCVEGVLVEVRSGSGELLHRHAV